MNNKDAVIDDQVYLFVSRAIESLWGASAWLDNSNTEDARRRDPLLRDAISKLEAILDTYD